MITKTGWLAWLVLLVGCSHTLEPNGQKNVLIFNGLGASLGEGLSERVELPRESTLQSGCGKFDLTCDHKTFTYDFSGTSLEVSPPTGVKAASSSLEESGYVVLLQCVSALPDGVGTVAFRVRDAKGNARYEDSARISCEHPDVLTLRAPHPHYATGADAFVTPKLVKGERTLDGLGWTLEDPEHTLKEIPPPEDKRELAERATHSLLHFEALRPGGPATLHAGDASGRLPFDVVADSAWTLGIKVDPCSDTAVRPVLSGTLADGSGVGLPDRGCSFTVTGADGKTTPGKVLNESCVSCLEVPAQGTLCAELRGHRVCQKFVR